MIVHKNLEGVCWENQVKYINHWVASVRGGEIPWRICTEIPANTLEYLTLFNESPSLHSVI